MRWGRAFLCLLLWGCGGDGGEGGATCAPGEIRPCVCFPSEARGEAICGVDGVLRACACGDAGAPGGADGGTPGDCRPDCVGRACGDDGCGGACGACPAGRVCDVLGACVERPASCGDGRCGAGEDCGNCPGDCGECCGDGRCARDEDCGTCAADCGCPQGRECRAGACAHTACEGPDCGAPPRFLVFNVDVRTLTEGGAVTFTAVVTDPDGIGDLIGGVLEDPAGASYGAFATQGEEGAYSLTLTWAAIHAVRTIEFRNGEDRVFVGAFFDQAGNRTTSEITLTLHCDDRGAAACGGACTSLETEANCGGCGRICEEICDDGECRCPDGLTRCGGECVDTRDDVAHCGRCENACPGAEGGAPSCVAGECADPCAAGGETACGRVCADTATDVDNCGRCGFECPVPADGRATCGGGRCGLQCDRGFRLCDDACASCPDDGVATTGCAGAACVATACEAGFLLCDGLCARCPDVNVAATGCAGDRCVATACAAGTHPCAEGCCPWRGEDLEPVTLFRADIAVGPDGAPHAAFGRPQAVVYARRQGANRWTTETVRDLDQRPQHAPEVALVIAGERAHLAWSAIYPPPPGGSAVGEVRHQSRANGRWSEPAGRNGFGLSAPSSPDIAVDGAGAVHVCYDAEAVECVEVGRNGWNPVPISGNEGWNPSIFANGRDLHVAWWYLGARNLGYATRIGGVWSAPDRPSANAGTGLSPRVVVEADGEALFVHLDENLDRLSMTYRDGDGWRTGGMPRAAPVGRSADLALTPAGWAAVCVVSGNVVAYGQYDGRAWSFGTAAEDADGYGCALAVDVAGGAHILYRQAETGMLRYLY